MTAGGAIETASEAAVIEAMARAWWGTRGFVGEWGNAYFADQQDRVRKQMRTVLRAALAAGCLLPPDDGAAMRPSS